MVLFKHSCYKFSLSQHVLCYTVHSMSLHWMFFLVVKLYQMDVAHAILLCRKTDFQGLQRIIFLRSLRSKILAEEVVNFIYTTSLWGACRTPDPVFQADGCVSLVVNMFWEKTWSPDVCVGRALLTGAFC